MPEGPAGAQVRCPADRTIALRRGGRRAPRSNSCLAARCVQRHAAASSVPLRRADWSADCRAARHTAARGLPKYVNQGCYACLDYGILAGGTPEK